jgi:hypothetical protein
MVNPVLTADPAAAVIGKGKPLILLEISRSAAAGLGNPEKVREHTSD